MMKTNRIKCIVISGIALLLSACSPNFNDVISSFPSSDLSSVVTTSSDTSSLSSSEQRYSSSSSASSSHLSSSEEERPSSFYSEDSSYDYVSFPTFDWTEKVTTFTESGEATIANEYASFSIEKGYAGTLFSLEKGGSFTNSTPLTYVLGIKVDYERASEYGCLYYRFSDYSISSPNSAILPLPNDQVVTFGEGGFPYFAIYAAVGSFDIKSLSVYGIDKREEKNSSDIDLYTVNDVHGAIDYDVQSAKQIGASRMATYFSERGQENKDGTIFLSSGDMWQGSADSNMTRGQAVNEWMNMVGFESMALGNHEFDWTPNAIEGNAKEANFPYLCINLRDPNGNQPSWVSSSKTILRQGVKIGIIGAIGKLESSIEKNCLSGYSFASNYDSLIREEAKRLRFEEGCSLVFLSIHDSDFSTSNCHNIDAVLEGHTHQGYNRIDSYGIPHVQCYGNGSMIQHLKFKKGADGVYEFDSMDSFDYQSAPSLQTNEPFEEMNAYFSAQIESVKMRVVGTTENALSKDEIGLIGAQALYRYARKTYPNDDVVAAFINTYGVRQTIGAGDVTFGQIYSVFPFDNTNNLCTITGYQLRKSFLSSSYYYSYYDDQDLLNSLETNKRYHVMTLSYVSDGNYGWSLTVEKRDDYYLRNIVADYFAEIVNG